MKNTKLELAKKFYTEKNLKQVLKYTKNFVKTIPTINLDILKRTHEMLTNKNNELFYKQIGFNLEDQIDKSNKIIAEYFNNN